MAIAKDQVPHRAMIKVKCHIA
ncbi:hypothetical protein SGPA1_12610 [Streptomyces misionensis JCM 4497]